MNWRDYQVSIPEGSSGLWSVKHQQVTDAAALLVNSRHDEFQTLLDELVGETTPRRIIDAGSYTALTCMGKDYAEVAWMSDHRMEIEEHFELFERAHGDVLIHGLGLGMCALGCARKPEVRSVLVIERSKDVIQLVEPSTRHPKITVQQGNAYSWTIPRRARWDVAWHDIWPLLSEDNVPEMDRLEIRFWDRCGWQASWQREWCERRARQLATLRAVAKLDLGGLPRAERLRVAQVMYQGADL